MNTQYNECPNCGTKLKSGLFSYVDILTPNEIAIINLYSPKKSEAYCNKCGEEPLKVAVNQLKKEKEEVNAQVRVLIESIPVLTIHSPKDWDYEIIDLVTGQSTTGTGVLSEVSSSLTDVFGLQSGRFNSKLKAGEDLCLAQLRRKTLDMNGNAVIGADIDYSEVGGDKGMLMVCMAGTALNLKNIKVLGEDRAMNILKLSQAYRKLQALNLYSIPTQL